MTCGACGLEKAYWYSINNDRALSSYELTTVHSFLPSAVVTLTGTQEVCSSCCYTAMHLFEIPKKIATNTSSSLFCYSSVCKLAWAQTSGLLATYSVPVNSESTYSTTYTMSVLLLRYTPTKKLGAPEIRHYILCPIAYFCHPSKKCW